MNVLLCRPRPPRKSWLSRHPFFAELNAKAQSFALHYPMTSFWLVFIAMPIFILLMVILLSTILIIPLSFIMNSF